jgi:hypothetical protein
MRLRRPFLKIILLIGIAAWVAACGGGGGSSGTDGSTPDTSSDPFPDPVLKIVGAEEIVYDWTIHRCQQDTIPDLAVHAFRDSNGQVSLPLNHLTTYRMIGLDLNSVAIDCNAPINQSTSNADPSQYSDKEWLSGFYTEDGETIYALVHNEYQGHTHPGQCPQASYFPCWSNTITLSISTDSGQTFQHASVAPSHYVAGLPYQYEAGAGPEGTRGPSNIIKGKDGYFYNFFNAIGHHSDNQWVCLMRTNNLSDPASWRFWDGADFSGRFIDRYQEEPAEPLNHLCTPLDQDDIGHDLANSILFNTDMDRYILVGISADHIGGREVWGFYYSFSHNLVDWTRRKLLIEMSLPWTVGNSGSDISHLYPSLLDPDSASLSFETVDEFAYLYFTRHNFGQGSLDRDLIRVPVRFFPSEAAYQESL